LINKTINIISENKITSQDEEEVLEVIRANEED